MVLCRSLSPLAGVRLPANRRRAGFPLYGGGAYQPLQSQPNPLNLTPAPSMRYPRNDPRQTHCGYLSRFQQFKPEKRPLFRQRVVARSEFEELTPTPCSPKPTNPLRLTSIYSVAYARTDRRQTHCGYVSYFQRVKAEKWPLFSQKMAARTVGRAPGSFSHSVSTSVYQFSVNTPWASVEGLPWLPREPKMWSERSWDVQWSQRLALTLISPLWPRFWVAESRVWAQGTEEKCSRNEPGTCNAMSDLTRRFSPFRRPRYSGAWTRFSPASAGPERSSRKAGPELVTCDVIRHYSRTSRLSYTLRLHFSTRRLYGRPGT